ncbi:MAG: lanthionine synthetase LanC family protein [Polyangiaceae bacterium]
MPTFDASRSAEALEIAAKVAADLPEPSDPTVHPSVSQGHAGIALFFAEWARVCAKRGAESEVQAHQHRASAHLEAALTGLEAHSFDASFASGIPGILWAAVQTTMHGVVACPEELFDDVDAQLLDYYASQDVLAAEFLYGAAGIGEYALARAKLHPHSTIARRLVTETVAVLGRQAIRTEAGIFWDDRGKVPYAAAPGIQLGTAHGVGGIVSFLSRAGALRIEQADDDARDAMRWLVSQRSTSDRGAIFPDLAGDTEGAPMLAWCHGDLGIICSLHTYEERLASSIERETFARVKERIATHSVPTGSDLEAPFVCHGAFGNAHLLRRLALKQDDARLHAAADAWWGASVASRRSGTPHDLYTGPLGMGLVAMGVADEQAQATWDGVLCVG